MIDSLIFFLGIAVAGFALLCAMLLTATRSVIAHAENAPESDQSDMAPAFGNQRASAPARH